jgi:dipeptidyl aminopeptidase/acylaminoacyl peptidase
VHGGLSALGLLDLATGRQEAIPVLPRDVVDECRLLPDGKGLLLTAESWSDPRGVWTIDLVTGEQRPLSSRGGHELLASRGATSSTVDIVDLTRPELRRFRARDGLELTGWLYRPDAPGPWPTMIHLHGGPEAQERPVYNSLFQSLVAAGVAVFAPNVRGSSGLGREFLRADDREKRYGAITDVADCVAHLTGAGIADPARVGVMGRSYGGYLTLAALVRHPELFAVGIDVCGMADFLTFYEHTEPWIAAAAMAKYGDPVADAELLTDLSPIHRIDRLRAPLLVVHGAEDTNVPVEEAEQVVAALARRGVPHRYLLFPGEGHDLLSTPNRVAFVQAAVAWVVEHLSVPAIPA